MLCLCRQRSVLNSWASMIVLARGSDLHRPVLCLAPCCSSSALINHQPWLLKRGNCALSTPHLLKQDKTLLRFKMSPIGFLRVRQV